MFWYQGIVVYALELLAFGLFLQPLTQKSDCNEYIIL
jgi:hypothetical protein